ncbi:spore germination protein [Neobacillus sp. DY30]|uniref:spore germination protein n=1 Tax=Neobacillus sp. DY30 TaxID=3047871 RepID=UPI0024BFC185|nr:spore germination protein [Neobacillus sp. DY30]WHY02816.1 spore germination protein [Neobacillus sp. DY30]
MTENNKNQRIPLSENAEENIRKLKMALGNSDDLSIRKLQVSTKNVVIIHIEGIVDDQSITENVISPIIQLNRDTYSFKSTEKLADKIVQIISVTSIEFIFNWSELLESILAGDTVILLDESSKAIKVGTRKFKSRSITEPTTQTVIKGPKDSFTENLSTNISLIRSRIQNAKLRLKTTKVGSVTKTDVGIMYMEGIADHGTVMEAMSRIKSIKIDSVLEANYIEEAVRDNRKTLFPLMQSSERPDVVTANLLEGKIAIIIQGTPFVIILPVLLIQFFQSPEDYYENNVFSSFLRLIRIGSFLLNMYASAVYLALITHHQGLIPTTLMVTLMAQRERVPFPAIIELLIMELAFEVLREAGVRMPRAIGPAVSIVGALILGQAAVEAGFVSAAIVIIVATSAINSFTLPNTNIVNTARGLRFLLILSSAFIGFYGILLLTLCILVHLCSLRSFGVPYFAPLAPFKIGALKDSLIRFPITSLNMNSSKGTMKRKQNEFE